MNIKAYFIKNQFIYGVSEKYSFGKWSGYKIKFTDLEKAEEWLKTEEYDFRERFLCSKTRAKRYKEIENI